MESGILCWSRGFCVGVKNYVFELGIHGYCVVLDFDL